MFRARLPWWFRLKLSLRAAYKVARDVWEISNLGSEDTISITYKIDVRDDTCVRSPKHYIDEE